MDFMSTQPTQEGAQSRVHLIQGPLQRHTHAYDLIRQCIHCGFCLPACPTYAVLGMEMDSPRGRIYQMQAVADGKLAISDDFIEHMNCCVGCRACETACPSGVQFGQLIEAAREQIQLDTTQSTSQLQGEPATISTVTALRSRGSLAPLILRRFFFDYMLPLRPVLALVFAGLKLYQRSGLQRLMHKTRLLDLLDSLPTALQGQLKLPEALMDTVQGDLFPARLPEITPALGIRRYRVGLVSGCIMDQAFHAINQATVRVLTANGCEVITPVQQSCCGALHVHAGEAERGRALARHNIDVFEPFDCDAIIINSAGCGSTLKEYYHLLRDDAIDAVRAEKFSHKVKDISEFLCSIDLNQQLGAIPSIVAYHDACHLLHGQKIKQQPRQLLNAIPGLSLVELKESDWCCGSAGIYNLTNQSMAQQLLERKMQNVFACGASILATANPGCMLQIALGARQQGYQLEVVHPVELLDQAYRAGGAYDLSPQGKTVRNISRQAIFISVIVALLGLFLLFRRRFKRTV